MLQRGSLRFWCFALAAAWTVSTYAADKAEKKADKKELPTYTDPAAAGPDFTVQGEYAGEISTQNGQAKLGVQVIALGDGKFRAVAYRGGLPGDGWDKESAKAPTSYDGQTTDGVTSFPGEKGRGEIKGGVLTVFNAGGEALGAIEKIERKSPTLGAKPPAGAIVLFDGTNTEAWEGGKMTADGLLEVGVKTRQSFGSCRLHLEFRTPFMPTARGQARGNSGVYLQHTYEFQVLDSFGLEGKDNECGGLYKIMAPRLNMCYPPLSWQTYDFDFTAPKFESDGKKTANARVTLKHNGVLIYNNLELPELTPGGRGKEAPTGPLYLQNHNNPVHYRNIWLLEVQ